MTKEQWLILADKWIKESGDKMYKEMTDTWLKKLIFWWIISRNDKY